MINYIVKKRKITLLFFIVLIIVGVASGLQLPKQLMPDVVVKQAMVTTVYAGANPDRVEQTVTKILEQKIKEVPNLKTVTSTSSAGVSSILIEAQPDADAETVWNDLRKKIQDVEADLPDDADKPIVNDNLTKSFVQSFALYGKSTDDIWALNDLMHTWEDQLRSVEGVTDVVIDGIPEQQVRIDADMNKLQQYGIAWESILQAIQSSNDRVPTGTIDNGTRSYELNVPLSYDVNKLKKIVVYRSDTKVPVYLEDVANVQMSHAKAEYLSYYNGVPSIAIKISSEVGSDVPTMYERVNTKMTELQKTLPANVKVTSLFAQKDETDRIFHALTEETLIAIAVVVVICMLGLNMLTSLFVALAIPVSIAIAMILLPSMGITLNQMTVVGLIIVLGILVDDAVVVNDNIERRLSHGESPSEAAVNGTKEVAISILTATLATIAAFAPLLLLTGDIGEFIRPIPVIISLAMLASMVMSLTIIPIFREWYETRQLKKGKATRNNKPSGLLGKQIQGATDVYAHRVMPNILKRPVFVAILGLLFSTLAYVLVLFTPVELFPKSDNAELTISVQMPSGTSIEETNDTVQKMAAWVKKQPGVTKVSSSAGGTAAPLFSNITSVDSYGTNQGAVVLTGDKDKLNVATASTQWATALKKDFPAVTTSVSMTELGIPVGKPVSIRISGNDLAEIRKLTDQVKGIVASTNGATNVSDTMGIESYSLDFVVNQAAMDQYQVTYKNLTQTLLMMGTGVKVGDFDTGKELIDMKIYMKDFTNLNAETLFRQANVTNEAGVQVPLSQIGEMKPSFSIKQINHYNLERVNTIEADVSGRTATEVMGDVQTKMAGVSFPDGYKWETGGETSKQSDIFVDLGKLFIVVIMLIIILITMQFYSLWIPVIIMTTVYLAAAGGVLGLFITRTPIGFMSMMGVISLAGIVVRNGIVLIEFIEDARKEGKELKEAIILAASARFRPILLTSLAAIVALIPMATVGELLFRPLAIAIIFGLLFSTVLTLLVVPSLYMVLIRSQEKRKQRKLAKEAKV
ncbi:efflux RND transporter permease subunit [Paenibacillus sp. PK4536]|uniref:efflux RND transporter permease subunit n=1 Tax=Paenibacillus sp. PK4536 TaxID=3024576 RepID=UPI0023594FB1|nr:efflux RND transporter permease subunit [Paenibacillus sp. PK4536]WIM40571.1 efflux RND transporter permease subunit [Paenibacillus sp. PK4536]